MRYRAISMKFWPTGYLQSSHPNFQKKFVSSKIVAILNFKIFCKKNCKTQKKCKPCKIEQFRQIFWPAGYLCRVEFLKFKMAAIFDDKFFFFENWDGYSPEIPCGSKISSKSLYIARFTRCKHFCVLQFFAKDFKIQFGRHFWRKKFFLLKIGMATLQTYPVGQKFCRNCAITHGFRDLSIFVFCNFCQKFEKSKWLPFLAR